MRAWMTGWSRADYFWIAVIAAIVVGLTVGDGVSAAVAVATSGTLLGQIARTIHMLTSGYWLAAFPILGIAAFRFVALARD